jgi:hypothetical protein
MDARTVARAQALGRIGLGTGLLLAPGVVAGAWVGAPADRPGGRVLAAAMGARDVGLGVGLLRAVGRRGGARAWMRAGVVADAADLVATLRARDDLPPFGAAAVAAMAAASVLVGAWLQGALD